MVFTVQERSNPGSSTLLTRILPSIPAVASHLPPSGETEYAVSRPACPSNRRRKRGWDDAFLPFSPPPFSVDGRLS